MRNGDPCLYHSYLFPLRTDGSVSGSTAWNGTLRCADDPVYYRNGRPSNCVDLRNLPGSLIIESTVYFLSGILDPYDHHAGDLFLVCKAEGAQTTFGRECRIKTNTQNIRESG